MGSEDHLNWIELDKRVEDKNLNGKFFHHHFICKSNKHGNMNNRYRYIRYIQNESYVSTHPFNIYITFFELYGDIKTL